MAVQANTSANMQAVQANTGATMQVDEQAFEEYCSVMDSLRPKYLDRITEILDNPATQRTAPANILGYFKQIQSWLQVRTLLALLLFSLVSHVLVYVPVSHDERVCVKMCVSVRDSEREREMCVSERKCVCVCVYTCLTARPVMSACSAPIEKMQGQ